MFVVSMSYFTLEGLGERGCLVFLKVGRKLSVGSHGVKAGY